MSVDSKWKSAFKRGVRCLEIGDFPAARGHFKVAHRHGADIAVVSLAWARALLRDDEVDEAEEVLRASWRRERSRSELAELGIAESLARLLWERRGRNKAALELLDELDEALGVRAESMLLRGEIYCQDPENYAAARRCFEQARELGAGLERCCQALAVTYNAEGLCREHEGDNQAALGAFKRAADLDPGWSAPVVNRGVIFAQSGCSDKARELFRAALVLEPDNPKAMFNLAESLRLSGRAGDAIQVFTAILARQPEHAGAEQGLAKAQAIVAARNQVAPVGD